LAEVRTNLAGIRPYGGLCCLLLLCLLAPARGQWLAGNWQFRRQLDVNWDANRSVGGELATADIYTAGHVTDGSDVRVTLPDGRIIPSHVLGVGPGDLVRLVFELSPGQTRYDVYFGNPNPPPPPVGTEDVRYDCGLLMEMKAWSFNKPQTSQEEIDQWQEGGPIVGRAMIDQPFYTEDPLADQARRMFKITGSIYSLGEADYFFAGAAYGEAALCVDGEPVLFIPGAPKDTRYNVTLHLTRGRHDFVIYYVRVIDKGLLALSWRPPGQNRLLPIPRTAFGVLSHAMVEGLEENGKPLVADFDAVFEGECPIGELDYSYRYQFSAFAPPTAAVNAAGVRYDWDFGDGITAGGAIVEHVYAIKGVYPVRLTVRAGDETDTQTTRFFVDRLRDDKPPVDTPLRQAQVLATYDPSLVPESWLVTMAGIERDAQLPDAEMAAAVCMTRTEHHADPQSCVAFLKDFVLDLETVGKADEAVKLLDNVPAHSDLQPVAAAMEANVLTWWLADFPRALTVAQRVADATAPAGKEAYAQALVLCGQPDQARKIFEDLEDTQEKADAHLSAISGAMARTLESRIDEKNWQDGEDEWQTWQDRCPDAFMEGNSVLLHTELLEQRFGASSSSAGVSAAAVAAKVDEAFANAVQDSPFAPQMLYRAARLLSKTDPDKSRQLHDLLKTRYPEDPLGQQ